MGTPDFLVYFSHANVCILLPGNEKLGDMKVCEIKDVSYHIRCFYCQISFCVLFIHLYSGTFSIDLILDWIHKREKYIILYLTPGGVHRVAPTLWAMVLRLGCLNVGGYGLKGKCRTN